MTEQRSFAPPLVIGVVADTHVYPNGHRKLPQEVPSLFRRFGVGLILHAGDANTLSVVRDLGAVAPVIAVTGNNDDAEMFHAVPEEAWFDVGRFRFGLVHGHGGSSARAEAKRRFAGKVDFGVYGHSHVPKVEKVGETVLFNPGSPTERRWNPHFGIGVITVTATSLRPELILFDDPRALDGIAPQ